MPSLVNFQSDLVTKTVFRGILVTWANLNFWETAFSACRTRSVNDSDQTLLAAQKKVLGFLWHDSDPRCLPLQGAELACSRTDDHCSGMGPILLFQMLCQDTAPGPCQAFGRPLSPLARPALCHSVGSLSTCSGAVLGSSTYHFLLRLHATVRVLLLDLWSLPQPLSAWIRRHSLFSRSYFSGCFKTPNMPGTTSLMRQAEEVAMAVAEKNPSARPTRSLSTSLFPLRVFQGRRNRLSPLHFLRSSQAGLTLDMLHESSRNLEKPFLPMTASFPSENLAIDPDKI